MSDCNILHLKAGPLVEALYSFSWQKMYHHLKDSSKMTFNHWYNLTLHQQPYKLKSALENQTVTHVLHTASPVLVEMSLNN